MSGKTQVTKGQIKTFWWSALLIPPLLLGLVSPDTWEYNRLWFIGCCAVCTIGLSVLGFIILKLGEVLDFFDIFWD